MIYVKFMNTYFEIDKTSAKSLEKLIEFHAQMNTESKESVVKVRDYKVRRALLKPEPILPKACLSLPASMAS